MTEDPKQPHMSPAGGSDLGSIAARVAARYGIALEPQQDPVAAAVERIKGAPLVPPIYELVALERSEGGQYLRVKVRSAQDTELEQSITQAASPVSVEVSWEGQ